MIEKASPIARFLVVSAAFVVVVSGLKMAGPLLVPFFVGCVYCHDCFAIANLA